MSMQPGWLPSARHLPSPNFGPRPKDALVRLVVVHNISLPPGSFGGPFIDQLFTNQLDPDAHPYFKSIENLKVSAHVLIRRDGEQVQYVSFNDRAWHAGSSCYLGEENCNDFSIGIELEGDDQTPFTNEQYQSLVRVVNFINAHYPLTKDHLAGHSDIAPGRKTDPGPCFDWVRFRNDLAQAKPTHFSAKT